MKRTSQSISSATEKRRASNDASRQGDKLDVKQGNREDIGKLAKSEIESLRKRLQRLNDENDELLDKLSGGKRRSEAREAAFEEERIKFKQRFTEQVYLIHTLQSTVEQSEKKLGSFEKMKKDIYRLKMELDVAERARKEVEKREQLVIEELEELKQRLSEKNRDKRQKQLKIKNEFENRIRIINDESKYAMAAIEAKNNRLSSELDENLRLVDELKSQNAELQQNISDVTEKLGETQYLLQKAIMEQSKSTDVHVCAGEKSTLKLDYSQKSKKMKSEIVKLQRLLDKRDGEVSSLKKQLSIKSKKKYKEKISDTFDEYCLENLFSSSKWDAQNESSSLEVVKNQDPLDDDMRTANELTRKNMLKAKVYYRERKSFENTESLEITTDDLEEKLSKLNQEHANELASLREDWKARERSHIRRLNSLKENGFSENCTSQSEECFNSDKQKRCFTKLPNENIDQAEPLQTTCSCRNEIKLLHQQLNDRSEELKRAELDLQRTRDSRRRVNKELRDVKTQKDHEIFEAMENVQKFKKEVEQMSVSATSEAEALREAKQLKEKLALKSLKLKELKGTLQSYKKSLEDMESASINAKSTLHQENLKLKHTLRDRENKLKAVKESITASTWELSKTQKELSGCHAEVEDLKRKLAASVKEIEAYKAEVNSSSNKISGATISTSTTNEKGDTKNSGTTAAAKAGSGKLDAGSQTHLPAENNFSEILEKNKKQLEPALTRLLANDELTAEESRSKMNSAMKQLILEKEGHIFELQAKVTALSKVLNRYNIANKAGLEALFGDTEIDRSEKPETTSDVDILMNKYRDIQNSHRKLLEETTLLRAAEDRRIEHDQAQPTESPNTRAELLRTKRKLRASVERIAQLEGWLDDIYSDPDLGLGPRPKESKAQSQLDSNVYNSRPRNSESSPRLERRKLEQRFALRDSSKEVKQSRHKSENRSNVKTVQRMSWL